jgi:hypothetical protein
MVISRKNAGVSLKFPLSALFSATASPLSRAYQTRAECGLSAGRSPLPSGASWRVWRASMGIISILRLVAGAAQAPVSAWVNRSPVVSIDTTTDTTRDTT